jgi:diguanylate cyclase (GGDEF)-like protein
MKGARLAVERIRQDIEDSLDITISAGIALYKKGSSDEELIRTADSALYLAKKKGRNMVECA